jgi:hypothetical protein
VVGCTISSREVPGEKKPVLRDDDDDDDDDTDIICLLTDVEILLDRNVRLKIN